ncbi:Mur ligase family protein [Bacteriovorax sp. Seq25_V]|uniref:Mur ligase family protein n=1 Tax=Bacteriovorax sp. Seq25_V TaxID=1201288 RepID=UPI00038A2A40|nr:UDP-N-acetylmuramoyl-L-alanyl-D-glutamate--2,6-diaminopimelate ligase [Bacteriovorax sp. Seq25_V]EQC43265.1 Mur ligase family, glutamate ligase domain protein [Bacteriovorax sp. Seq25_V]
MNNAHTIKSVTTNIQDADSNSAVFYRINEGQKNKDLFIERLKNSQAQVVYVYSVEQWNCEDDRVVLVNEDEFLNLQEKLCNDVYPNWSKVKVIGVTGTNGKSTIVHLCQQILSANGQKAFTIGTIGVFDGEKELLPSPGATTPSAIDLKRILHTLSTYDFACIEVSSHALAQGRLKGIELISAGFTNLTQDHLDYHGTLENYFLAKVKILEHANKLYIPAGEDELKNLLDKASIKYTVAPQVDVSYLKDSFQMSFNLKNISLANSLVVEALGKKIVIPTDIDLPKGRFNLFSYEKSSYVVDYAHTPDAILNLCSETRKAFPNHKIITVFGCGGDRDRAKRVKMLEAALPSSDEVIVTTDNPRTEDPEQIISDIVKGHEDDKCITICVDRKKAIDLSVRSYSRDTIVLIAGKGHEEYQDIMGVKHHFSDIEEVKNKIEILKNEDN